MGGRGALGGLGIIHPGGSGSNNSKYSDSSVGFQEYKSLKDALGKKGRPEGIVKAAEKSNPHYDPTGSYAEFTENCQRAVVAYEARRRGYDVTAQPSYKNDNMGATAYINPKTGVSNKYWMGSFQKAKAVGVGKRTATATRTALENQMKKFGDGSRAVMSVTWKHGKFGHALIVEQKKGRTLYIDPQAGKAYNPKELFKEIKPERTQIVRIDNLRFSERAKKSVTKDKW